MTSIWLIAKKDFKSGFSTPKTGAVLFFMLLMSAIFFALYLQTYNQAQMGGGQFGGGQAPPLQEMVRGMIYNLQFFLLLIIPAITMGTFSEEFKTQSVRFLQTAPIRSLEIVLGKFLSCWFTLALAVVLCAFYTLILAIYGDPEIPTTLVAYGGLLLFIAYQVSFGIWVSSLTSQQIMAFLFTMLGLFGFFILNFVAPQLSGGGVLGDVLQYMAPISHFENFLNGLVTVEDVGYFLVMTFGFLFFANVSYDSRRWR